MNKKLLIFKIRNGRYTEDYLETFKKNISKETGYNVITIPEDMEVIEVSK